MTLDIKQYKVRIGDNKIEEFEESYEDERIMEPIVVQLTDRETRTIHRVSICEAFECCGKLYMYDFGVIGEKAMTKIFELVEDIALHTGYTYKGFIHQEDDLSVKVGLECGFKELIKFRNDRSGNNLSEMCKIIG